MALDKGIEVQKAAVGRFDIRIFLCRLIVLLCLVNFPVANLWAADASPEKNSVESVNGETLSQTQVDDLVAHLSDSEVRELLIDHLNKVAVPSQAQLEHSPSDRLSEGIKRIELRLSETVDAIPRVPAVVAEMWRKVTQDRPGSSFSIVIKILIFFGFGLLCEWLFRKKLIRFSKITPTMERLPFRNRLKLCGPRFLLGILCLLIFLIATLVAWFVLRLPTDNANYIFSSLLGSVLLVRLISVFSSLLLAPRMSMARLLPLDDRVAQKLYQKIIVVSAAIILLIWWTKEVLIKFEVGQAVATAIILATSMIAVAVIIAAIWSGIPDVARKATNQQKSLVNLSIDWRVLVTAGVIQLYLLAVGVSMATGKRTLPDFVLSLVIIAIAIAVDIGLRAGARQMTIHEEQENGDKMAAAGENGDHAEGPLHYAADQKKADGIADESHSYASVLINNGRIILAIAVVFAIARLWDLNLIGLAAEVIGARATNVLVNFTVTALFAYALWAIVSTAVSRIAGPEPEPGVGHGEPGGQGGSRLSTVLPLFRKFLFIFLLVILVLILLSSIGVDIGPLIAGAGIFGIAIGFGAQTLVRDIVSGLFFLLDDAFRVGEYVSIGDVKGTVEKISIRSLRLRHHNGPLHTIPFGEIQTLTNWSRDYAIMKFEIRVPFETDVDMIRKMIKKVGEVMLEDPELGPQFLEPLKSQGVNRMDDSSFIIRCKFTSKPGNQFLLRREAYARIQSAFEEQGIRFAPRRVIVESAEPLDKSTLAAAGAIDAQQEQGGAHNP